MNHGETLRWITDRASGNDAIRALVVTGSVAAGTADEWSDLDVEMFTRHPARLLDDDQWYAAFGEVLVVEALPNPDWYPTRLVHYVDGKIDFAITPADGVGEYQYERPFRILRLSLTGHRRSMRRSTVG
jgi:aminoglycoside 6-adenylyltransferase